MNVVKLHLGKAITVIALLFSLSLPAIAQEVKIGVVNVPVLMEQAPRQPQGLEAAGNEPAEVRVLRRRGVDMKGLRVVVPCERRDQRFAQGGAGADEAFAFREVLEIALGHSALPSAHSC